MIDAEKLIYDLLTRDLDDGVTVMPAIDVDVMDTLPLVTFHVTVGQAIDNSSPPQGWVVTLNLDVFDDDLDDAKNLSFALYDVVWAWGNGFANPPALIEDVGGVAHDSVDDNSIFTRVLTVEVESKRVTQYAGSFELTLRPSK
jgi:hypothetical protein